MATEEPISSLENGNGHEKVETEVEHQLKLQRAMEDLQAETTVDVEWLYRNKKKKRPVSTIATASANTNTTTTGSQAAPSAPSASATSTIRNKQSAESNGISPSTSAGTTSSHTQTTSSTTTSSTSNGQPSLQEAPKITSASEAAPQQSSKSMLSKALRPRSTSDPKRGMQPPPPTNNVPPPVNTPAATSLTRSTSLNEHTKPQKPIKSLFSAFSKLKNRSAPTSPSTRPAPIPIPTNKIPHHSLDHHSSHSQSLSSSIESISPTFHTKHPFLHSQEAKERVILNKNPNRALLPIKELSELKLRRVTFALDKLSDDPPQQIPSRRPKKGDVVVLEDLLSNEPLKLSIGITNEAKIESKAYDEREIKLIRDTQRKALEEAEKHAQEAHKAAQRIAQEVSNFKNKRTTGTVTAVEPEVEVEEVSKNMSTLEIDKPIHLHEHHFEDEIMNNEDNHIEISLEAIYTRCCHLREILPIPATLKQLKNKSSPLQILKLLNPKPTLIDVYSFSDFIAIVPIKTLVFDNVTMTTEMFKIILSSLLRSTSIEKLSLRNVPIDAEGWKYLCKFLSRNKSLHKLDISQQKIKTDLPLKQHRSEMDWQLFVDTLVHRGGIEELLINGCKLPIPIFQSLIEDGVSIKTVRLGVCQIDLTIEHLKILMNWAAREDSNCEGLDLGFNDLNNDKLKPLIKKIGNAKNLQSISINSTQLVNVEDVALLIRSLSKLPNLRFLDLSNLKQIFPSVLPYLNKYLPRFPKLTRLHLDFNEFSTKSISIIAEIIPKCLNLGHVSIIGLSNVTLPAAASLYSAAKSSNSLLNLDLDYELIDENISSRIALCLMRNMESSLNHHPTSAGDTHDDLLFDGSLIAETAGKLIDKISNTQKDQNDEFSQKFLQTKFLEKIARCRTQINKTIDDLLDKRAQNGQLKLQEKEDLLRFYFLDTSLAHIVELFQNLDNITQPTSNNQITTTLTKPPTAAQSTLNETPHQMAVEMNGTPIDMATGKPVLLRSVSQTSVQAKKQEEEEGEFHRWGFFVQQQRQMLPTDQANPTTTSATTTTTTTKPDIVIPKLPSGSEIRDAVIKAKGIDSISSLIDNVNHDRFNLNTIYSLAEKPKSEVSGIITSDHEISDDTVSGDEIQGVDEAYDKILNDLSRVRSNK